MKVQVQVKMRVKVKQIEGLIEQVSKHTLAANELAYIRQPVHSSQIRLGGSMMMIMILIMMMMMMNDIEKEKHIGLEQQNPKQEQKEPLI